MELSKRLEAVARLVTKNKRVADIGCDHGYVSIYLIREGIATKVIAMDVNKGPLEKAKLNMMQSGYEEVIETRLSDGAKELQGGEVDAIICAGMGGRLMVRILEDAHNRNLTFDELILQPQSELFLVRQYVRMHGYRIVAEDMVLEDGKYYPMFRACKVENEVAGDLLSDYFGPCLLHEKHKVLEDFLQKEYLKYSEIVDRMTLDSARQVKRNQEIKQYLEQIKEALSFYE